MPTLSPYPHSPARSLRPASRSPASTRSRSALLSLFTVSLLLLGLPLLAGCGSDSDAPICTQRSPCRNGGTCTDTGDTYACTCAPGYSGTNCEVDVDECAPKPCQNGGTCTDGVNGYTCKCPTGWMGASCESAAGCPAGFADCDGDLANACEVQVSQDLKNCGGCGKVCPASPNGTATCAAGVCGFTCAAGFSGPDCLGPGDPCDPNPCQNDGACTPAEGSSPSPSPYTCFCAPGFKGESCEIDVLASDECATNPCGSGSTCTATVEGHVCSCPAACAAANDCQHVGCDPTNGQCAVPTPLQDGTACTTDGDACTVDTCKSGQCAHVAGPAVCNSNNCDSTGLVCNQQTGDCSAGTCRVAQDTVPGAPVAQTITLGSGPGSAVLQVAPNTTMTIGGVAVTTPVQITAQEVNDASLVPSSLPTTDPVLFPIYRFGPSGTQFSPPLLFTLEVPLTATSPRAWLCDDAGLNCAQRGGFLTVDSSASPPRQTLTVAIDHFSTLVVTQSATAVAKTVCVTLKRGPGVNVADSTIALDQADTNFGGLSTVAAGFASAAYDIPLFQWDLSSIPSSASISSAKLVLGIAQYAGNPTLNTVYALADPWNESTVTWNNSPRYYGGINATSYGNTVLTQADLTGIVQDWRIGYIPNYGVQVYNDAGNGYATYYSGETLFESLRPRLDVCYTVGCPGPDCNAASGPGPVAQVSAGEFATCALKTDGTLACWGSNSGGQLNAPGGTFTQVSAGNYHGCALRTDGQVSCWGNNYYGQATPPSGTFTQVVASKNNTSCGIRTGGAVACWGNKPFILATPAGSFKQISLGVGTNCGVHTDGTAVCWGSNTYGEAPKLSGTFAEVATSGTQTTCALFAGGIKCAGNTSFGASITATGSFTQVTLGYNYGCALQTPGSVPCWGLDNFGQGFAPANNNFTQVSAGPRHACAVTAAGTVLCWGLNNYGQSSVPAAFTASPTCSDGMKNGSETATDCGGSACSACAVGLACGANGDCASGQCSGGTCQDNPCAAKPCQNGGTCTGSGSSYTCACGAGFSGTTCAVASPCSSLAFAGSTFVAAANPASLHTASVTVASWFKFPVGGQGVIAQKKGSGNGGWTTYGLAVDPGGLTVRFQTSTSPDFLDLYDAAFTADGNWHHAAATYDAATGNGALFLDGQVVATGTHGTGLVAADPTQPFAIGAHVYDNGPASYATGDIADVLVYGAPLNSAQVVGLFHGTYAPSPLAWFRAAEGAGTTSADSSGNGHTLTVAAGGWAPNGPFCPTTGVCSSLAFTGSSFATAANPTSLHTTSVTLASWFKFPVGGQGVIAQKKGSGYGGWLTYSLHVNGSGLNARFQIGAGTTFLDLHDAGFAADGKWHHAAATYEAATGQAVLFLDGLPVATGTQGTGLVAPDPAQPFVIGADVYDGGSANYATGDIADVLIYGTALSGAQVAGLFQGTYAPGPLAWFPASEGTSTSSADASGNGHTLTVSANGWAPTGPFCPNANVCSSLAFDGASFVSAANPTSLHTTSVTLSSWFRFPAGGQGVIAQKKGSGNGGWITYGISVNAGGLTARFQIGAGTTFLDLYDAAFAADGKWHQAAATYDAATGNGALFLDGQVVATGAQGTGLVAPDPTQPFALGADVYDTGPGNYATGDIADVLIYGTALSPAQVAGFFHGTYPANPLAWFATAEGTGTTSADKSGNGHTLTVAANGWSTSGPFCH
jgi:Concanavalin A-like lectin/glucanases superfamily/Regulator of chromosome condensation (RCC1) repeat/EGF-like domain/Human growth factor-like EGF